MGKGYSKEYYENYDMGEGGVVNYIESQELRVFMASLADKIVNDLHPKTVLDAGCAMGLLVAELRKRGVDAYGMDFSEYAVENADPIARSYCIQGSLADPIPDAIPQKYDLITCIEVLEHMSEEDGRKAIKNLCTLSDTILFCSTPDDFEDPTHINIHQRTYWVEAFAQNGFYDDLFYRPTYVTEYAICFRKKESISDQLRIYEQYIQKTDAERKQYNIEIYNLKTENQKAICCSVYFDTSEGFKEANKQTFSRIIKEGTSLIYISEEVHIPKDCKRIRIDPCEGYLCAIESIRVSTNGRALTTNPVNGFGFDGFILFPTEDPQLIIQLPIIRSDLLHIELSFKIYPREDLLLSTIEHRAQVVTELKSALEEKEQEKTELKSALEEKEQEKTELKSALEGKEQEKTQLHVMCEERRTQIENLRYEKQIAEGKCAHLEMEYDRISNSTFWKMSKPMRVVLDKTKSGLKKHRQINLGLLSVRWRMKYGKEEAKRLKAEYIQWNYPQTVKPVIAEPVKQVVRAPREDYFSILVPLYNTPKQFLKEMIESVQAQTCPDWELCLADASDKEHTYVEKVCREYAKADKRIRYQRLEKNLMISGNTNEAAKMATGEYIALLDHDDLLAPTALEENLAAIQASGSDVLYSDEDHLFTDGNHGNPFFKPDWSPDLLCSQMYVCHFLVIRHELFDTIGGFRSKFDGSQDYDLMLRLSEKTDKIHHIPKILYTWRESPTSTAANAESKPYAQYAGKDALDEHLKRVYGEKAHADESEYTFVYDARYPLPDNLLISIIIPMRDKWELTNDCIRSIIEKSTWKNYEILVLDNRSENNKTKQWFKKITREYDCVRVIKTDMEFNWSKINNFGMKKAKGDVFIFLNNDTVVITPDWMERLAEKATRKGTGIVGPLLLYEDGTIQHAGVIVGMGGWADHVFKGMQPVHFGAPFVSPMVNRNVMAVTGACMAVSRKTIEEIGPFDESFIICGSDVELGIRAHDKGLYNVYDATVRLYHLESKSRDSFIPEVDFQRSYEVYTPYREGYDPYFNPNLDPNSTSPRIRDGGIPAAAAETVPAVKAEGIAGPAPDSNVGEVTPMFPRKDEYDKPRLNLLIPSVDEKHVFGGIATAIKIYEALCDKLGWDRRIITTDTPVDSKHVVLSKEYAIVKWKEESLAEKQVVAFNDRTFATLPVGRNDVFVATGWWTAYTIREVIKWQKETFLLAEPKNLIYFVQDYEPGFYPWSSRYLMADSTYQMDIPIYAILNAGLLKEYFDKQGYQFTRSWCFEPTLNEKLKEFLPKETKADKKKQILIYGRPGTPRNAFELICMSLREFISMNPQGNAQWTFLAAGEPFADVDLGSGAVLRSVGKLTLQEYANTMLETYAAISLMVSPHPSYPPLEMATFGIQTITNRFGNKDLSQFSRNIHSLGNCAAKSIAEELNAICREYTPKVEWQVNEAYISGNSGLDEIIAEVSELTRKTED